MAQEPEQAPEAAPAPAQAAVPVDLDGLLAELPDANLSRKQALIAALATEASPAAHRTLRALLR
jgi:hypothetical protein